MPNGTLKVTPRNATPKSITNSSSLAAILGLKQEAPSKLTLTESQAFISANLTSLGELIIPVIVDRTGMEPIIL